MKKHKYMLYVLLGIMTPIITIPLLYTFMVRYNRIQTYITSGEISYIFSEIRFFVVIFILFAMLFFAFKGKNNLIKTSYTLFAMRCLTSSAIFVHILHIGGNWRAEGYFQEHSIFGNCSFGCDLLNHYADEYLTALSRGYVDPLATHTNTTLP